MTDKYGLDLTQVYKMSLDCQKATGDYGGKMKMDHFRPLKNLPTCYFNLPVLYVEQSHGYGKMSSPCWIWADNTTSADDPEPKVGDTYLPPNLAEIFDRHYCSCDGGPRVCGLLPAHLLNHTTQAQ